MSTKAYGSITVTDLVDRGITGTEDWYKLSNSTSETFPSGGSGWTKAPPGTIPVPTSSQKYLWFYEITTYSDGTTSTWGPVVIGTYGEKGDTGVGYVEEKKLYYLKNSDTSAPTKPDSTTYPNGVTSASTAANVWTISCPPWQSGYYYWTCHQFKKDNNTYSWTDVILDRALTTANENASNAVSTANSKAQVYYSSSNPSSGSYHTGDIWVKQSSSGIGGDEIWYYSGSAWTKHAVGTTTIIDGSIVTDKIAAEAITAGKLDVGNINSSGVLTIGAMNSSTQQDILNSNISIGGTNLARNTGGVVVSGLGSEAGSRKEYQCFDLGKELPMTDGEAITISFDLYMPVVTSTPMLLVYNTNNMGPHQTIASRNVLAGNSYVAGDTIDERIVTTGTITDRDNANTPHDWLEFYSNYGSSNFFSISNLKVERGNQATDWSPAPEDITESAASEEQYIYISKPSGTTSVSGTTTWVTNVTDAPNTWTTKRPIYDSSYPVLFVAKQRKTVSGAVTCTTPIKDDTTTIIDGGHITTGTIDASRVAVSNLTVGSMTDSAQQLILNSVAVATSNSYTDSAVGAIEIGGRNLLKSDPKEYAPSAYCAYQIYLTENLQAGQTYTIQFWDVNVAHSGKTAANLGISVYWGGGNIVLRTWNGTSYFTNGHADYLTATFTVSSAQASGQGAQNPWLHIYNSVPSATGTMSMSIGKWKLENCNKATDWTPAPEDVDAAQAALQTQITQNASAIELKASQTSVDNLSGRMTTAESNISTNATNISSKVSQTDYTGAKIASLINQSASTVQIEAEHIELDGNVVMKSNLTDGTTTISGANIKTGTISADRIDAANLQVQAAKIQGSLDASHINLCGTMPVYQDDTSFDSTNLGGYLGFQSNTYTVADDTVVCDSYSPGNMSSTGVFTPAGVFSENGNYASGYAPVSGGEQYTVSKSLPGGTYKVKVFEYAEDSANATYTYVAQSDDLSNNGTVTFNSNTTHIRTYLYSGQMPLANQKSVTFRHYATVTDDSIAIINDDGTSMHYASASAADVRLQELTDKNGNSWDGDYSAVLSNGNFTINADTFIKNGIYDSTQNNVSIRPVVLYQNTSPNSTMTSGSITIQDAKNYGLFYIEVAWSVDSSPNTDYNSNRAGTWVRVRKNGKTKANASIMWYDSSAVSGAYRIVTINRATGVISWGTGCHVTKSTATDSSSYAIITTIVGFNPQNDVSVTN